jgi:soluble lytic murein transglycosylase-like protein
MRRVLKTPLFSAQSAILAAFAVMMTLAVSPDAQAQSPRQDLRAAQEAAAKSDPSVLPREILRSIIEREADFYGIPADLIETVIEIESGFRPKALNAGAIGLMQIMLPTARAMGYKGTKEGLFDPETNIRYGAAYLAAAQEAANGDLCGTVMRYQSGIDAIKMNKANRAYCAKAKTLIALNNRVIGEPERRVD